MGTSWLVIGVVEVLFSLRLCFLIFSDGGLDLDGLRTNGYEGFLLVVMVLWSLLCVKFGRPSFSYLFFLVRRQRLTCIKKTGFFL